MVVIWVLAMPARASLTLERAVALAQENDPWVRGSLLRQEAMEASSVAAGSLPDPMLSLGLANLPTDTFDFDQEAMTQFKVGLSQVFPRGDSRALRQRQLQLEAGEHPFRREERRARVAQEVSLLWLDSFLVSQTIALIERDRNLFEHLVDVAESSYASARGAARQQDLIRAQLELTRLEDRLTRLDEQRAISTARLGEWLPESARGMAVASRDGLTLPDDLPQLSLSHPELVEEPALDRLAAHLGDHPAILGLERRIDASVAGVELAEQKYRPQWRIDASYGYRDDDPMGRDRADFFSLGVAFDLPLFTSSRQDREVQAAVASSEATRTDRALGRRAMITRVETPRTRRNRQETPPPLKN